MEEKENIKRDDVYEKGNVRIKGVFGGDNYSLTLSYSLVPRVVDELVGIMFQIADELIKSN